MLFKWLGPPLKSTNKFQSIQPYYTTVYIQYNAVCSALVYEIFYLGVVLQVVHDVMRQALCSQPVVDIDTGAVAALAGQKDLIRSVVEGGIQLIIAVCSVSSTVSTTVPLRRYSKTDV